MRNALLVLLAFAAGVAVMLMLPGHGPSWMTHRAAQPHAIAEAAPATADSAPAPSTTAPEVDDLADNWPGNAPSPEQVIYAQPRMVREALEKLGHRAAGKPNLYLIAFAGDGGEDVFRNEAEFAGKLFGEQFGANTHTLIMVNNPSTLQKYPLATWSNLELALDGVRAAMQPDQDILMLYVTSHGDEDHTLLVDMDPLPLDQIGADDLATLLAKRDFKWKVIVVNACYSGGFVPPLRGPGTLVMTAARTDRSSFGCGADSDFTYFGRAWLIDALKETPDFVQAFNRARQEISQWEKRDSVVPSEPQINVGAGIADQLARWRAPGRSAAARHSP
ncbi:MULTISPECIES: C13 family peptidase [Dyella]|uniref:Peptidase C13 n=2 Tax=Dyella TaxID=231454 RepID=A0A4R0Z111_9GAMM|nr:MULTISPECIES: C13 family peptidase [Dyella]TBR39109.1 peptidase C13 [Dyella terrae]TCI13304.1 peptidase C13 [Dyella soli]